MLALDDAMQNPGIPAVEDLHGNACGGGDLRRFQFCQHTARTAIGSHAAGAGQNGVIDLRHVFDQAGVFIFAGIAVVQTVDIAEIDKQIRLADDGNIGGEGVVSLSVMPDGMPALPRGEPRALPRQ